MIINKDIESRMKTTPLKELYISCPALRDLFRGLRFENIDENLTFFEVLRDISELYFEEFETSSEEFARDFAEILQCSLERNRSGFGDIGEITILPGKAKDGSKEEYSDITVRRGDIISIVGPTGSGKSRLLEDIECLAQGDTPTGRTIMLNRKLPSDEIRFSVENRLIAQLSQNMNFVMDLTVSEFLHEHAQSRMIQNEKLLKDIFQSANDLAGEKFTADTPLTQLSGGQSRALMIADTAFLSESPIILIDEIENAGIDRLKAMKLLSGGNKIVFISTHDPLLALSASKRLVIKGGAICKVIEKTESEARAIPAIERQNHLMQVLRERIRRGEVIDFDIDSFLTCIS